MIQSLILLFYHMPRKNAVSRPAQKLGSRTGLLWDDPTASPAAGDKQDLGNQPQLFPIELADVCLTGHAPK
jgi:hypothetical protein